MPRQSLTEYLTEASQYADGCAVVHRRGYRTARWTYQQLMDAARQFARELEARGIARGDRVMLWGGNSPEWIAAFWGTLLRRAVVVPMDRIAAPEFARAVARQTSAKLVVADREIIPLDFPGPVLFFEDFSKTISPQASQSVLAAGMARSDLAEIIFTSGTTAEPRGVALTHANLLANLEPLEVEIARYRKYERWVHPLRLLHTLPLSHVFGQFMGLFVPQLLGATVVFEASLNPSELIRTAQRERVSVVAAVPRLLESLKDKLERDAQQEGRLDPMQRDLQAAEHERFWRRWWRFRRIHRRFGWKCWVMISGGAALNRETETFWSRLGFLVIQGYGLTETASLISLRHPFGKGAGSIGKSLPGREMKLDETGEILVRGENVAAGYWSGEQLQPVAGEQGWFRTGDLGEMDAEGHLYFKGRKKNVLVSAAGMNIYPQDLEAALRRQPEVKDCVVVGVRRGGNEEPCAVLLLRPGAAADHDAAAKIVERANATLAEYQRMRRWQVWPGDDFPRTPTQKPRLNLIRDAVEESTRTGPSAGESAALAETSPLTGLLRRMTHEPELAISPQSRLEEDLKFSSMDRVELLSELEDRYQMDLNEAVFSRIATVGEIETLLRRQPGERGAAYPYARWPRHWAVAALRWMGWWTLVWPAMLLLGYPRVRGREKLRATQSPVLVVSNHVSEIDAAFLLAALPGRLRRRMTIAMGGERLRDLRHPPKTAGFLHRLLDPLGYLLVTTLFHVFPLPKQSGVRGSFQFIGDLIDHGWSVLIFPEGQLSKDGSLGPFRSGIGALASTLDCPVIPMKINGLFEVRKAGRWRAATGEIEVVIATPAPVFSQDNPQTIAEDLRRHVEQAGNNN